MSPSGFAKMVYEFAFSISKTTDIDKALGSDITCFDALIDRIIDAFLDGLFVNPADEVIDGFYELITNGVYDDIEEDAFQFYWKYINQ